MKAYDLLEISAVFFNILVDEIHHLKCIKQVFICYICFTVSLVFLIKSYHIFKKTQHEMKETTG